MTARLRRWLFALRKWLIYRLAGDMTVVIGLSVHNGDVYWREAETLLARGTFKNNRFYCETPETEQALRTFLSALQDRRPR